MELISTNLADLKVIRPRIFQDSRGSFVKTFHQDSFQGLGLAFTPREEFFSVSAKGVIRGMHFQLPPVAHSKLVYCVKGRVLDVVLDLRKSSASYGQSFARELNATACEIMFIPVGFAHGFLALEDHSVMVYQTTTVHSPQHDTGVRWDSFGFNWPAVAPVLSERDRQFSPFADFPTPF